MDGLDFLGCDVVGAALRFRGSTTPVSLATAAKNLVSGGQKISAKHPKHGAALIKFAGKVTARPIARTTAAHVAPALAKPTMPVARPFAPTAARTIPAGARRLLRAHVGDMFTPLAPGGSDSTPTTADPQTMATAVQSLADLAVAMAALDEAARLPGDTGQTFFGYHIGDVPDAAHQAALDAGQIIAQAKQLIDSVNQQYSPYTGDPSTWTSDQFSQLSDAVQPILSAAAQWMAQYASGTALPTAQSVDTSKSSGWKPFFTPGQGAPSVLPPGAVTPAAKSGATPNAPAVAAAAPITPAPVATQPTAPPPPSGGGGGGGGGSGDYGGDDEGGGDYGDAGASTLPDAGGDYGAPPSDDGGYVDDGGGSAISLLEEKYSGAYGGSEYADDDQGDDSMSSNDSDVGRQLPGLFHGSRPMPEPLPDYGDPDSEEASGLELLGCHDLGGGGGHGGGGHGGGGHHGGHGGFRGGRGRGGPWLYGGPWWDGYGYEIPDDSDLTPEELAELIARKLKKKTSVGYVAPETHWWSIATPGNILDQMNAVNGEAATLDRDMAAFAGDPAFTAGWKSFLDSWKKFYDDHQGWFSRLSGGVGDSVVSYGNQLNDWRTKLASYGAKVTAPAITAIQVRTDPTKIQWQKPLLIGGLVVAGLVGGGYALSKVGAVGSLFKKRSA